MIFSVFLCDLCVTVVAFENVVALQANWFLTTVAQRSHREIPIG